MTGILDEALETYRRERFFAGADAAYEALSTGEQESYHRELGELDGTVSEGVEGVLH